MSIVYLQDNVEYTPSTGSNYTGQIDIVFEVNTNGSLSSAYIYTQALASTDMNTLQANYDAARELITDGVLLAYAQNNPTVYIPPVD